MSVVLKIQKLPPKNICFFFPNIMTFQVKGAEISRNISKLWQESNWVKQEHHGKNQDSRYLRKKSNKKHLWPTNQSTPPKRGGEIYSLQLIFV